ncbi:Acg family FMN-binding oxidoreductase [Gandjariella thermophila]|nr:nitroreductase family protein [Gandjariella thermophila]
MSGRPDEDTLASAVALATRAPSLHNTQPWRWRLGRGTLSLYADRGRRLPATDPYGHELLLSCGAALHHLRLALAAAGWAPVVHRIPDRSDPELLATVRCQPREPTDRDVALAAAIRARRTDRRRYGAWQVPPRMLARLAEAAAEQGVVLRAVLDARARYRLVCAMAEAAALQRANPAYTAELDAWTGRRHGSPDGVPSASVPPVTGRYGDLPVRVLPRPALPQPPDTTDADDASVPMVLGTAAEDRLSLLRAGEALSAVLLAATRMGLATCPLGQVMEVECTRDVVRTRVLDAATYPQAVLRVGRTPATAGPLPSTPRRPLDEVIEHAERVPH